MMRTRRITKLFLGIAACVALPITAAAQQGESHIGKLTGHSDAGKQLFYRYTLPTDQDLYNSLVRGFVNSAMPSWITLTDQNRADLIAFIKTFSARWKNEKSGDPIKVPPETKLTTESIKHGQELFQKLECWKCHGQEGRGDGPSASTLTDSNDQPIRPYNFAVGSRFKCGATNQDLYKIFITGLDGTPMPSFADVIKPEDAWDLVHFLRTLQVTHTSPELTLWESTKEGAAQIASRKISGTPTGSGIKQ